MRKILYLGLDLSHFQTDDPVIHCPLIKIKPKPIGDPEIRLALREFAQYTHILFTSKTGVEILIDYLPRIHLSLKNLEKKKLIAIGKVTAHHLQRRELQVWRTAKEETSEGLIHEILMLLPKKAFLFWPHSAKSRPIIENFLSNQEYSYRCCVLYDTVACAPPPSVSLEEADEIVFTSPSTVDAFISYFGLLPQDKTLTAIGPITRLHLAKHLRPST